MVVLIKSLDTDTSLKSPKRWSSLVFRCTYACNNSREVLVLQVLREVHFGLWLVQQNTALVRYRHHIDLLAGELCVGEVSSLIHVYVMPACPYLSCSVVSS